MRPVNRPFLVGLGALGLGARLTAGADRGDREHGTAQHHQEPDDAQHGEARPARAGGRRHRRRAAPDPRTNSATPWRRRRRVGLRIRPPRTVDANFGILGVESALDLFEQPLLVLGEGHRFTSGTGHPVGSSSHGAGTTRRAPWSGRLHRRIRGRTRAATTRTRQAAGSVSHRRPGPPTPLGRADRRNWRTSDPSPPIADGDRHGSTSPADHSGRSGPGRPGRGRAAGRRPAQRPGRRGRAPPARRPTARPPDRRRGPSRAPSVQHAVALQQLHPQPAVRPAGPAASAASSRRRSASCGPNRPSGSVSSARASASRPASVRASTAA